MQGNWRYHTKIAKVSPFHDIFQLLLHLLTLCMKFSTCVAPDSNRSIYKDASKNETGPQEESLGPFSQLDWLLLDSAFWLTQPICLCLDSYIFFFLLNPPFCSSDARGQWGRWQLNCGNGIEIQRCWEQGCDEELLWLDSRIAAGGRMGIISCLQILNS